MSNQEHAELCRQVERIERRVTALQELGIDISSLTSQLSMAHELMNDGKYTDAHIFCEELISLADQLAAEERPEQNQDEHVREITKRFSSNVVTRETITEAVDSGLVSRLIDRENVDKLLPSMENTAFIRSIVQHVSGDVLSRLHEQGEGFENLRIEQALRHSIEGGVEGTGEGDIIHWLVHALMTGAVAQSIESFTGHLEWQLQHMVEERTASLPPDEAQSARIVPSQSQSNGGKTVDDYQDSDSFSDLPQIPKAGESWGDDSSFRAQRGTDRSLNQQADDSDSVKKGESDGYEPATGSSLRAHTSVFTEASVIPLNSSEAPEQPAQGAIQKPTATSLDVHDDAFQAITDFIAEQQKSGSQNNEQGISKQQLKHYLRDALPELLQEDDIKQAIFAALAVEVLCKPSVLGSMTGLREYLRQELLVVQEQMQNSE